MSYAPFVSRAILGRGMRHVLLVLPFLLLSPSAHAQDRQSQEREAKKACLAGDYLKGVTILSELYADSNDPTYIFNGGRCFQQNGRYEEAILRFREYLRKAKKATEEDRSEALKNIADCQALMGGKPGSPAAVVQPSTPPAPTAAGQKAAMVAAQPETVVQQAPPPASPGRGLRIAGIVGLALGGAALATGVVLNLEANSLASDLESTTDYERSKESRRAGYETLGWVSYGVGAALVTGGAILYYIGRSHGRGATSGVALRPAFAAGHVGAVLEGAF
jgi:tetratricopeptide (TPR) repeat protein